MNKKLAVGLLIVGLVGCAGRAANPVMVQQYGDQNKSCEAIEKELSYIESEVQRLAPKTEKTGKNVGLGVAGAFLLVPWFFMDFSESEQVEIDAFRRRYNHLIILAEDKKCGLAKEQIPDPKPVKK